MKRIALIFLLLIPFILNGCEQSDKEIDQKIVFIYRRICFSSYINRGFYIDNKGNKTFYDLSNESRDYAKLEKLYEYLLTTIDSIESEPCLGEEELKEAYKYLYSIDVDAEIEKVSYSFDYGEDEVYGIRMIEDQESTFILIGAIGDYMFNNTDENAANILDILGDNIWVTK